MGLGAKFIGIFDIVSQFFRFIDQIGKQVGDFLKCGNYFEFEIEYGWVTPSDTREFQYSH